jgi:hypothetical protein
MTQCTDLDTLKVGESCSLPRDNMDHADWSDGTHRFGPFNDPEVELWCGGSLDVQGKELTCRASAVSLGYNCNPHLMGVKAASKTHELEDTDESYTFQCAKKAGGSDYYVRETNGSATCNVLDERVDAGSWVQLSPHWNGGAGVSAVCLKNRN